MGQPFKVLNIVFPLQVAYPLHNAHNTNFLKSNKV